MYCLVLFNYQILDLERIQKVALRIILKDEYVSYEIALKRCELTTLSERRNRLALRFAKKCTLNPKTKNMFPEVNKTRITRVSGRYEVLKAKTERLSKSSIPQMQRLLNRQ